MNDNVLKYFCALLRQNSQILYTHLSRLQLILKFVFIIQVVHVNSTSAGSTFYIHFFPRISYAVKLYCLNFVR